MYSDFFGLKQGPFNNTPDPRFFFNTPDHEEAVASLVYAAQERKGFVLLTGEVGSGKTLVSRLVLSRLERTAKFAVVHNTRVGPRELLFSICREFDVRVTADASAPEMSRALEEFLLDQYARDRLAVVIVDEAQHLTTESFEELRLLGNLEADDAKLLSVSILGQPELREAFRLPEMQQLQQRLFRSDHLQALSRELTEGYIAHRLRIAAGMKGQDLQDEQDSYPPPVNLVNPVHSLFDRSALDAIYAASGGIPRLINQICDGAMLAAYTRSTKKVTAAIVAEVLEQNQTAVGPLCTAASNAVDFQAARKDLEGGIAEAACVVAEIESRSQGLTAQMSAALRELQRAYQETSRETKQASGMVREQSESSLGQLRATMEQINQRAHAVRQDLVELADQVKHGSARSVEGLKSMVAELLQQIDDKTAHFRRETEQSCDRIGRLEHRFGEVVGSAKAAVQQIVDDARARFDAAQLQAAEMLAQAQAASAATHEQAAIVLAEARGSAQRLREQLDQAVQRADAASENSRRELQELRTDLRKDRDQVREQIIESKSLLSNARQEAARIVEQARSESTRLIEMANATTSRLFEEAGRFERESQARAERIIHHARETEGRVDSLLRLPKEIIDEAGAKTAALAELSKSLTSVIAQLSAAGTAARAQNQEIAEAGILAEERLEGLRSHSARVGQLVGVIRQLYGIMDARIEGLRGRLDQAEHLCRTVPQEIDGLRSALGGGGNGHRSKEEIRSTPASRDRRKEAPQSSKSKAVILKPTAAAPTDPTAPGMLGDIVSRNRKLHEWLRQTLHESESNADNDSERRIDPAAREIESQPANA